MGTTTCAMVLGQRGWGRPVPPQMIYTPTQDNIIQAYYVTEWFGGDTRGVLISLAFNPIDTHCCGEPCVQLMLDERSIGVAAKSCFCS